MAVSTPLAAHAPPPVNNLRAALWMFGSAVCFSLTTLAIKLLATHLPVLEVGFLRCLMSLFALVPILLHHGFGAFRTAHPKIHLTRIACASFGVMLAIYGLRKLQLATAVSLSFT